jgi:hypothetical protein
MSNQFPCGCGGGCHDNMFLLDEGQSVIVDLIPVSRVLSRRDYTPEDGSLLSKLPNIVGSIRAIALPVTGMVRRPACLVRNPPLAGIPSGESYCNHVTTVGFFGDAARLWLNLGFVMLHTSPRLSRRRLFGPGVSRGVSR